MWFFDSSNYVYIFFYGQDIGNDDEDSDSVDDRWVYDNSAAYLN